MIAVRRQIEEIEPAIDWLQRMFDKASTQYIRSYNDELAAKRNVVNASAEAGLKFGVHVNLENGGKKIPLSANVKTIADAVNFICQNTNGLVNWLIYTESVNGLTTRRSVIAKSKNIDSEIFFALIKKYGDSTTVIDAEIGVLSTEKTNELTSNVNCLNGFKLRPTTALKYRLNLSKLLPLKLPLKLSTLSLKFPNSASALSRRSRTSVGL